MLESTSLSAAKSLLARVRGLCVDMGTELSLADLGGQGLEASDYIPAWMARAAPFAGQQHDDELLGSPDLAN